MYKDCFVCLPSREAASCLLLLLASSPPMLLLFPSSPGSCHGQPLPGLSLSLPGPPFLRCDCGFLCLTSVSGLSKVPCTSFNSPSPLPTLLIPFVCPNV